MQKGAKAKIIFKATQPKTCTGDPTVLYNLYQPNMASLRSFVCRLYVTSVEIYLLRRSCLSTEIRRMYSSSSVNMGEGRASLLKAAYVFWITDLYDAVSCISRFKSTSQ